MLNAVTSSQTGFPHRSSQLGVLRVISMQSILQLRLTESLLLLLLRLKLLHHSCLPNQQLNMQKEKIKRVCGELDIIKELDDSQVRSSPDQAPVKLCSMGDEHGCQCVAVIQGILIQISDR